MKNTKEIQAILTAVFCLNRVGDENKDITLILDYAFRRIFGANTNLLMLACVGHTLDEIKPSVMELMEKETEYKAYLEEYRK